MKHSPKKWIFLWSCLLTLGLASPSAHAALCKVGDSANVLWGGKWWPAKVIAVNEKGNSCKVHYKGYSNEWNEWVGPKRIRITSSKPQPKSDTSYYVGQPVKVLWGNKWWNARVLQVKDDKFYIHYDGYGKNWDEWVGHGRIRKR